MTKRWKIKTNTVNSLLVLIVLILVKAGWTEGQTAEEPRKLNHNQQWTSNNLKNNDLDVIPQNEALDSVLTNQTFHKYLNRWNVSQETPSIIDEDYVRNLTVNPDVTYNNAEDEFEDPQLYDNDLNSFYGESVADTLFHESTNNNSMILTDLSKCLVEFNLITCLKMLLLNRVNNMIFLMERNNLTRTDLYLLDGYVAFKLRNETEPIQEKMDPETKEDNEIDDDERYLNLDQELSEKVVRLFQNRSLQISLLPGFGVEIKPAPKKKGDEFVCFSTRTFIEPTFNRTAVFSQMRKAVSKDGGGGGGDKNKNKKKKKGGFSMMPMMMIPQMIMLGFMPFALANLKMMVMNAFMMNTMALNSAIFMTIRNLIFGPRGGPKIKYVNYGYKHHKVKSKRPEVILHSPAAFVHQPEVHKPVKHVSVVSNSYPQSFSSHGGDTYGPPESAEDVSGPYPPSQYSSGSSEFEDYDHSGQHSNIDEQLNLNNIKYTDDNYGEFSNPASKKVSNSKRIIVRKTTNRRKSGYKPMRIKKRPKLPAEVKSIVDKLKMKNVEKKPIPMYRIPIKNLYKSTTHPPISEEESDENTSQDVQPVQPTNLYHPITNYYYPGVTGYNYPQIYRTTERSNTWSVPEHSSISPSVNPYPSSPYSYNNYQQSFNFQDSESPDFDILRLMPDVRNQIYQKPTERTGSYYTHPSTQYTYNPSTQYSYSNSLNKNTIDRVYSTKMEDRNDHQISTDYRTVFSSKYNKDHVNFDNKHSDNRHKNHNYSRM